MDDHCVECRLYGSNYSYDEDGDIVSNCYDCPFEPYARGEEDDDTISRRAAIDAFAPYAEYESNRTNAEWVRRINMVLSALPSAQPETAKRIVGKSRDGMTLWYQCDMCNEPVDAQDNFCRGCGRRLTDG